MDLVDEFLRLTADLPSVEIFRRWSAITLVSGALSRKTYSKVAAVPTYPNLYALLVGLPGTGKSVAIRAVQEIAREHFEDEHVAPDSLTSRRLTHIMSFDHDPAAKVDHRRGEKEKTSPKTFTVPRHELQSKLVVFSSEFSSFLKEYDQDMMKVLSDLWDAPAEYRHETQHFGSDVIYNAYLTILGGVQPWWFGKLPATAFEQGFATRLLIVHSSEEIEPVFFSDVDTAVNASRLVLIESRLEQIQALDGKFEWMPAARTRFLRWVREKENQPTHAMLAGYNRRRHEQLIRLAMISAASATAALVVRLEDVERAIVWLREAESTMPGALEGAGASPYHHHEIAIARFVHEENARTKRSVPEATVRRFMARNVPPNLAEFVLEGLIAQSRIISAGEEKRPNRRFLPGRQEE